VDGAALQAARAMTRRSPGSLWATAWQRAIGEMTRTSLRVGAKAIRQAVRTPPVGAVKPVTLLGGSGTVQPGLKDCVPGVAFSTGGARRYYLYKPPGLALSERLPLLVMLHGCGQDAERFAVGTRMNRVAARERFLVLYLEQDRISNPHRCWNWYETRSRQAYGEASIILSAIDQVCLLYPVDRERVALAGMSAGASMGALLATRYPKRFKAVVMHSGVPPGAADSAASAFGAMRGRRGPAVPAGDLEWPPLLVIQGSRDRIVDTANGTAAAELWAAAAGARPLAPRQVQRGARYPMSVTEFKGGRPARIAATLCEVAGLGHAWSGGASGERFSDEHGPDASRMIWAFMQRQFKARAAGDARRSGRSSLKPASGQRTPAAR
jgi:poly(hydroxyalkanoate) depolymerase family esterase